MTQRATYRRIEAFIRAASSARPLIRRPRRRRARLVAISRRAGSTADDDDQRRSPRPPLARAGASRLRATRSPSPRSTRDRPGVVYIEADVQRPAAPTRSNPIPSPRRHRDRLRLRDRRRGPHPHQRARRRRRRLRPGHARRGPEPVDAEVVGADPSTDIAVLRADAPSERPASRCRSAPPRTLEVGDPVVAIGNPFGLDRTVTSGIVSALQRQISAPERLHDHRRDPDRRADQPRQLRRPADRRDGRGDRDQLPDRDRRRQQRLGRDRLRRPDRHRHARSPSRCSTTARSSHAYLGITGADVDARARRRAQPRRRPGRARPGGRPRTARPTRPASRPASATVDVEGGQVRGRRRRDHRGRRRAGRPAWTT